MSDGEVTEEDMPHFRGGNQQPAINSSTTKDREAGDQDTTLLDVSLTKENPIFNKNVGTPVQEGTGNKCDGVKVFLAWDKHSISGQQLKAKVFAAAGPPPPERSVQDVYTDYPALKFTGLDADGTLHLAGQAAKHIALEATFAFLRKCISPAERDTVWALMITATRPAGAAPTAPVNIPAGVLDHPTQNAAAAARASSHQLLANCIAALKALFSTHDATSLAAVFGRCIALCDALADVERAEALDCTLKALQWLVLELSSKKTQLYCAINTVLVNDFYLRYPLGWEEVEAGAGVVVVSAERRKNEKKLLAAQRERFEEFKVPFPTEFGKRLQALMAVKGKC